MAEKFSSLLKQPRVRELFEKLANQDPLALRELQKTLAEVKLPFHGLISAWLNKTNYDLHHDDIRQKFLIEKLPNLRWKRDRGELTTYVYETLRNLIIDWFKEWDKKSRKDKDNSKKVTVYREDDLEGGFERLAAQNPSDNNNSLAKEKLCQIYYRCHFSLPLRVTFKLWCPILFDYHFLEDEKRHLQQQLTCSWKEFLMDLQKEMEASLKKGKGFISPQVILQWWQDKGDKQGFDSLYKRISRIKQKFREIQQDDDSFSSLLRHH